jgi:hypothetical protein
VPFLLSSAKIFDGKELLFLNPAVILAQGKNRLMESESSSLINFFWINENRNMDNFYSYTGLPLKYRKFGLFLPRHLFCLQS